MRSILVAAAFAADPIPEPMREFRAVWVATVANGRAFSFPELSGQGIAYATVDLSTGKVTPQSLASAIPSGTNSPQVLYATPSPDGKTLYALVIYQQPSTPLSGVMIVAVDVEDDDELVEVLDPALEEPSVHQMNGHDHPVAPRLIEKHVLDVRLRGGGSA